MKVLILVISMAIIGFRSYSASKINKIETIILKCESFYFRLSDEGIYCRVIKKRKQIYFWDIDKLNIKKRLTLMDFMNRYIDSINANHLKLMPITLFGGTSRILTIQYRDCGNTNELIYYSCYDEALNKVIDMIHDLIPITKRRKVDIKRYKVRKDEYCKECIWKKSQ